MTFEGRWLPNAVQFTIKAAQHSSVYYEKYGRLKGGGCLTDVITNTGLTVSVLLSESKDKMPITDIYISEILNHADKYFKSD